jgi:hypothetical protein
LARSKQQKENAPPKRFSQKPKLLFFKFPSAGASVRSFQATKVKYQPKRFFVKKIYFI